MQNENRREERTGDGDADRNNSSFLKPRMRTAPCKEEEQAELGEKLERGAHTDRPLGTGPWGWVAGPRARYHLHSSRQDGPSWCVRRLDRAVGGEPHGVPGHSALQPPSAATGAPTRARRGRPGAQSVTGAMTPLTLGSPWLGPLVYLPRPLRVGDWRHLGAGLTEGGGEGRTRTLLFYLPFLLILTLRYF